MFLKQYNYKPRSNSQSSASGQSSSPTSAQSDNSATVAAAAATSPTTAQSRRRVSPNRRIQFFARPPCQYPSLSAWTLRTGWEPISHMLIVATVLCLREVRWPEQPQAQFYGRSLRREEGKLGRSKARTTRCAGANVEQFHKGLVI